MNRLAISNIAWLPDEDDVVAELLHREGITGIEIAPTKWRERPLEASNGDVLAYRETWETRGLPIVSLQSLLFGRPDLQLFGDDSSRAVLLDYLRRIIDLAAALGARALVFGSPKNRVRGSLSLHDAGLIASDFFRALGDHAASREVVFCIEANPPTYGCDFITTTAEAVELCKLVAHPAIRVNADLGGMTISGENVGREVRAADEFIGHFHASEPQLGELGVGADHTVAARALDEIGYRHWVSIEMRAPGDGENVAAIARVVRHAKEAYGSRT